MTNVRGLSTHGSNLALDAIFGSGTPSSIYVGLVQSFSGDTPTGEPTIGTNGYTREAITNNATNFPAASSGAKTCQADVIWTTSTGAWATGSSLTIAVLFDAASGGNALGFATLPTPVIVNGAGITVEMLHANSDLQLSIIPNTV